MCVEPAEKVASPVPAAKPSKGDTVRSFPFSQVSASEPLASTLKPVAFSFSPSLFSFPVSLSLLPLLATPCIFSRPHPPRPHDRLQTPVSIVSVFQSATSIHPPDPVNQFGGLRSVHGASIFPGRACASCNPASDSGACACASVCWIGFNRSPLRSCDDPRRHPRTAALDRVTDISVSFVSSDALNC